MILIQWQITSFYCDAMDRMRGELLDAANVGVWHFRDITTCSGHFRFRGSKRSCGGDRGKAESDAERTFLRKKTDQREIMGSPTAHLFPLHRPRTSRNRGL